MLRKNAGWQKPNKRNLKRGFIRGQYFNTEGERFRTRVYENEQEESYGFSLIEHFFASPTHTISIHKKGQTQPFAEADLEVDHSRNEIHISNLNVLNEWKQQKGHNITGVTIQECILFGKQKFNGQRFVITIKPRNKKLQKVYLSAGFKRTAWPFTLKMVIDPSKEIKH